MQNANAKPETTPPPPLGFIKQLEDEWNRAREDLARAASEGREAQARWHCAVVREMEASRRYRKAALEGVWP